MVTETDGTTILHDIKQSTLERESFMKKFRYRPTIRRKDAVMFIAETVYQEEPSSRAKKRVRERIRYAARDCSELRKQRFDTRVFFTWAIKQWPKLKHSGDLPTAQSVEPDSGRLALVGLRPVPVIAPTRLENLKHAHAAEVLERHRLERENESHRQTIEKLRRELDYWTAKNRRRLDKASNAGKLGGRPRKK